MPANYLTLLKHIPTGHMQEKSPVVKITDEHVRAARGLLKWTLAQLAEKSGVTEVTINKWENGRTRPSANTRERIRIAFEEAGIVFTNGNSPGVKRRPREGGA